MIGYRDNNTPFSPRHQTHRENLWRFLGLVVVLMGYFAYLSWKFDAATGAWLALLSWSFFVLCTPVADGGFIVAFPVRLLLGTRLASIVQQFLGLPVSLSSEIDRLSGGKLFLDGLVSVWQVGGQSESFELGRGK